MVGRGKSFFTNSSIDQLLMYASVLLTVIFVFVGHLWFRLALLPLSIDEQVDHYQTLGVDRRDSIDAIRKAFKVASLRYHPDKDPSPEAKEMYAKVITAYEVLSEPLQRKKYDDTIPSIYRLTEGKPQRAEVAARQTKMFEVRPHWWTPNSFDLIVVALSNGRVHVAVHRGSCLEKNSQQQGKTDSQSDGRRHVVHISIKEESWQSHCIHVQGANLLYPSAFDIEVVPELDVYTWVRMVVGVLLLLHAWRVSRSMWVDVIGEIVILWIIGMIVIPRYMNCACNIRKVCYGADWHPFLFATLSAVVLYFVHSYCLANQKCLALLRLLITAALCIIGTMLLYRSTPSSWWPATDVIVLGNYPWLAENIYCGVIRNFALFDHWGVFRLLDTHAVWLSEKVTWAVQDLLEVLDKGRKYSIINGWEIHMGVLLLSFLWNLVMDYWEGDGRDAKRQKDTFTGKGRRLGGNKNRKRLLEKQD